MPRSLASLRQRAFIRQSGLCYYCGRRMWERDPHEFMMKFQLSGTAAALLACTAEHLQPKSVGGKASASNIVAACRFCNQTRHRARNVLPPFRYRVYVQTRIRRGAWLPKHLAALLRSGDMSANSRRILRPNSAAQADARTTAELCGAKGTRAAGFER